MTLPLIFSCAFAFIVRLSSKIIFAPIFPCSSIFVVRFSHKILPPFYQNSGWRVVMKSSWLLISLFDVAITFIAESEINFV